MLSAYIYLQNLRFFPFLGEQEEVFQASGDEDGVALVDLYGFVGVVDDMEWTVEAHVDDKGIQGDIVFFDFPVEFQIVCGEIFATDQLLRVVFMLMVVDGVLFLLAVVDDIRGEVGMEFPGIAVFVATVVVVNPVGDVRRLLDFSDETAFADGMDGTGRNKEAVAFFHLFRVQQCGEGVAAKSLQVFLFCGVVLETHD